MKRFIRAMVMLCVAVSWGCGEADTGDAPGAAAVAVGQQTSQDCTVIDEDVVIQRPVDGSRFAAIDGCFVITGGLFVQQTGQIADLSFLRGLREVGGYVAITDNDALGSVDGLDDLERIGEWLVIEGNARLERIRMASLQRVEGNLHIFGNPEQELSQVRPDFVIDLPALRFVGQSLLIAGNDAVGIDSAGQVARRGLVEASMPLLETVRASVFIENNDELKSMDLSSLEQIGGDFLLRYNQELVALEAPSLQAVPGTLEIRRNAALVSISMAALATLGRLIISEHAVLETIAGFGAVGPTVSLVEITDNRRLPTCEALAVVDAIGRADILQVDISGNDDAGACP